MSLSLNSVVNVQLNTTPKGVARKDFGAMALVTSEAARSFSDKTTRYIIAASLQDVAAEFGSSSQTVKAAEVFFAQNPRPKQLVIARWNKDAKSIDAVASSLSSKPGVIDVESLKSITDGALSISIGGSNVDVTGIDLHAVTDLNSVASTLNTALSSHGVAVTADNEGSRILITANTAGSGSAHAIGYAHALSSPQGTYIGARLGLENGQGAIAEGKDQVQVTPESAKDALMALEDKNSNFYGFSFVDGLNDNQITNCAMFAQSTSRVFGVTVNDAQKLEDSESNVFKKLKSMALDHTIALYDPNDAYAVVSLMARLLAVNYEAPNSTITLKFKVLPGVSADDVSATQIAKAKALGINVYTTADGVPMVTEGMMIGGKFADEVVGLDWLNDAVQKNVFNVLYKSGSKVPGNDRGQTRLIAAVKEACDEAVNNGFLTAGTWRGDDIGTLRSGEHLANGYYIYAESMDNRSDDAIENRRATPIVVALKLAGAVHSVDVIINYNR